MSAKASLYNFGRFHGSENLNAGGRLRSFRNVFVRTCGCSSDIIDKIVGGRGRKKSALRSAHFKKLCQVRSGFPLGSLTLAVVSNPVKPTSTCLRSSRHARMSSIPRQPDLRNCSAFSADSRSNGIFRRLPSCEASPRTRMDSRGFPLGTARRSPAMAGGPSVSAKWDGRSRVIFACLLEAGESHAGNVKEVQHLLAGRTGRLAACARSSARLGLHHIQVAKANRMAWPECVAGGRGRRAWSEGVAERRGWKAWPEEKAG